MRTNLSFLEIDNTILDEIAIFDDDNKCVLHLEQMDKKLYCLMADGKTYYVHLTKHGLSLEKQ